MKLHPAVLAIASILLIGLLWQIFVLFFSNQPITNFPPKGARIVALGDSLTVGIGASTPQSGLIPVLEKRLDARIENRGVSGNTTQDALLRLGGDVLDLKPNIVIILLGGNDYLKKVPREDTFNNLRTIIESIQKEGGVVVLLGIRGGLLEDHFDEHFEKLTKETGSLFVPNVLDNIWGNPALMSDEVHPNDRGYEKMVDKIAPSIAGLLASIPKEN